MVRITPSPPHPFTPSVPSSQQRPNRLPAAETQWPEGAVPDLRVGRDAHTVVDRRGDVPGTDGIGLRIGRLLVRGAVDKPAADAAAGEDDRVDAGPVVAAGAGVDLRGAAELARGHDEGRF